MKPPADWRWNWKASPAEIDEVQRRIRQLELAQRQLAEETEDSAQQKLADIEAEIEAQKKAGGQLARTMGSRETGAG